MKNINTDLLLKKNTNQILERLQIIVLLQIKGLNRTKYILHSDKSKTWLLYRKTTKTSAHKMQACRTTVDAFSENIL